MPIIGHSCLEPIACYDKGVVAPRKGPGDMINRKPVLLSEISNHKP